MNTYSLGLDIGTSSIKGAIVAVNNTDCVSESFSPKDEMSIISLQKGWAEQNPDQWWFHVCATIKALLNKSDILPEQITSIGISYQMHGLVMLDSQGFLLRNSIIWCDSRAVQIGETASQVIGIPKCRTELLNTPSNFTASKLKWVQENEPEVFKQVHKFMLPGDFIAYKFSGKMNTTISGLSEAILWDFNKEEVSQTVIDYFGFSNHIIPDIVENFQFQSAVNDKGALESGLLAGTPITYRSGDQPNNAFSLNVFKPGELAISAGTSGVVFAIAEHIETKETLRINNFAHVNHMIGAPKIGRLLNLNCVGIQYRWMLNNLNVASYEAMNLLSEQVPIGSNGLIVLPFGNGAERMFYNKDLGTQILNLNLNIHDSSHMCRATLEGVAFAFYYGISILKSDGLEIEVIKANNDNLFRAKVFSKTLSSLLNKEIRIYESSGAIGAARAAMYSIVDIEHRSQASSDADFLYSVKPSNQRDSYLTAYSVWEKLLEATLKDI